MTPPTDQRKSDASPIRREADESFTVDAEYLAPKLGLQPDQFMALLRDGRIVQATERGTDEDAGTWRLTFTYAARRWRLVVDAEGAILQEGAP
jgi:NFU1 iron-sulfur cluster scaffold homolog, mitochondrial